MDGNLLSFLFQWILCVRIFELLDKVNVSGGRGRQLPRFYLVPVCLGNDRLGGLITSGQHSHLSWSDLGIFSLEVPRHNFPKVRFTNARGASLQ